MKESYTMKNSVTVRNEKGSSTKTDPNCDTWIQHWEKYSGKKASCCAIEGCDATTKLVGAHTLRPYAKNEDYKNHPHIIPMCSSHNGKSHEDDQKTKPDTTFVWANTSKTCGK
ncbi:hypothetical protein [Dickeya zeae]|uniref:hypothetical protein n=1 Tax=Dickeya zeae TaxID=204042 RepID=UPI00126960FB|nr:hypothetical protein [Dickeya zeae]